MACVFAGNPALFHQYVWDIVFPEKMSGKEPRHTAADNQHIRVHIPPEPRKGRELCFLPNGFHTITSGLV